MNVTFLQELFSSIAERGRGLLDWTDHPAEGIEQVAELCESLISGRGEASGIALAAEIAAAYDRLPAADRLAFFRMLLSRFGADRARLRAAAARYAASPDAGRERELRAAAETLRQELLRRLNLAPGNTARLVAMRGDLLRLLPANPELAEVDADFAQLFGSWFNRGFLVLRRIDWSTSAIVLERIIRHEQVHAIHGWDDLRRRIDPTDRRCYAFFHPALLDEPLIFVEVALTREIPAAIAPLLAESHEPIPPPEQNTAVFYSISNTQDGLRGVSFGNFLIKQVADELNREIPSLRNFVTLSPVPGFAAWLASERAAAESEALDGVDAEALSLLDEPDWMRSAEAAERLREALMPLAAHYFLKAKNRAGRPVDAVARFHLGNGARLERLNWLGDTSQKGALQSHGIMVNYLYPLADIERNHEAYSNQGVVNASPAVRALLPSGKSRSRGRRRAGL